MLSGIRSPALNLDIFKAARVSYFHSMAFDDNQKHLAEAEGLAVPV